MSRNKNKLVHAVIACLLLLNVRHAFPDDTAVSELLNHDLASLMSFEVVTPTKSEMPLSDAPGSISVITYSDIQRSSARTIPDLLRSLAGVNVRWNPMVQTIDIRSFGANPFTSKVLLLIDGIPYNSWNKGGFPQHPGFDFFNVDNVRHIEVVRGPGASLYGENALNGVINIITLSGNEYRQSSLSASASAENTRSLSFRHGQRFTDNGSLFFSARYEQNRLPLELWEDADAEGADLFVKLTHGGFELSYYRRQDNFDGITEPFAFGGGTANFETADEIEQTVNIAGLKYEHESANGDLSIRANASYADRDGAHCAACHAPRQDERFEKNEDHGFQRFASAELRYAGLENLELLFGAEVRQIDAGEHSHEFVGGDHLKDGEANHHDDIEDENHGPEVITQPSSVTSYTKHALFTQMNLSLFDDALLVTAGLRYDSSTSNKLFDSQLFPRVNAVARISPALSLRLGWHQSARYPSFTELYQETDFFSAVTQEGETVLSSFVANSALQPEELEGVEIGLSYQPSSTFLSEISLYRHEIDDSIVIAFERIGFENHPSGARVQGIEWSINGEFRDAWTYYLNWSYQRNERQGDGVDSAGNPLEFTYAPEHKVNAGLSYQPSDNFSFSLDAQWKDGVLAPGFWYPIVFGDPTPTELDDYAYLNGSLKYRLPFATRSNKRPLTFSIQARNLTDRKVYETLTGIGGRQLGREITVGLEFDFID